MFGGTLCASPQPYFTYYRWQVLLSQIPKLHLVQLKLSLKTKRCPSRCICTNHSSSLGEYWLNIFPSFLSSFLSFLQSDSQRRHGDINTPFTTIPSYLHWEVCMNNTGKEIMQVKQAPLSSKAKLLWVRTTKALWWEMMLVCSCRKGCSEFKTSDFRRTLEWLLIHNLPWDTCGESVLLQSYRLCVNTSYLELIARHGHLLKICLIVLALARSQKYILSTSSCPQQVVISIKAILL